MSIHYQFYKRSGVMADGKVYVRPVAGRTIGMKQIARNIEQGTTGSVPDVKFAVSALTEQLVSELMAGNRVVIDGIGSFGVSLGGEIRADKNGKPRLVDGHVRDVTFRAASSLLRRLEGAELTSQNTPNFSSAPVDDEELLTAIGELSADGSLCMVKTLCQRLHLNPTTARKRLKVLEDAGRIENYGTRALGLYRLK